jgi:hypothetical protein
MVETTKVTDKNIEIEERLKSNLDWEKKRVKRKWDSCILISGLEGSGKSTFGMSLAYYMGWNKKTSKSNFKLDYVVFTLEEFERAVEKANPGQVIVWDEFILAGYSADALTTIQKKLIKIFVTHRFKMLKYILIIPQIWMLGWYFATARTSCLIHCYTPDGMSRGFYRLYNRPEKQFLFFSGSKFKTYKQAKCSISNGRFYTQNMSELGIDEEEYTTRKTAAAKDLMDGNMRGTNKSVFSVYRLINYIKKIDNSITLKQMVEDAKLPMGYQSVVNLYKKCKDSEMEMDWRQSQAQAEMKKKEFKMPGK